MGRRQHQWWCGTKTYCFDGLLEWYWWVRVGFRCEEVGFVESDAELCTTLLTGGRGNGRFFGGLAWERWTSTITYGRYCHEASTPLSFDYAVRHPTFCGRIASCSQCHWSPQRTSHHTQQSAQCLEASRSESFVSDPFSGVGSLYLVQQIGKREIIPPQIVFELRTPLCRQGTKGMAQACLWPEAVWLPRSSSRHS